MSPRAFEKMVRTILGNLVRKNGRVLMSSVQAIKPYPFYFLGMNPGGDPNESDKYCYETISESLKRLRNLPEHYSAFENEFWGTKLQYRVKWLFHALGEDIPGNVPASNLVFFRAPSVTQIKYPSDADVCWPVHENILQIVKPKFILVHGIDKKRSPAAYLHHKCGYPKTKYFNSGHGKWACLSFAGNFSGHACKIIAIPHLSRYNVKRYPEVLNWIRREVAEYVMTP